MTNIAAALTLIVVQYDIIVATTSLRTQCRFAGEDCGKIHEDGP